METEKIEKITKKPRQLVDSEMERIELAHKLGNKTQTKLMTDFIKRFDSWHNVESYLIENYPNEMAIHIKSCLYPLPCFCTGFGKNKKIGYKRLVDHLFDFKEYPARIPMSALIKIEEVQKLGYGNFSIVDFDLEKPNVDPFLFAKDAKYIYLLHQWFDKEGE